MKCVEARKLFGAFWDDESTRAEREWLESHFATCSRCRVEYEEFSRALEWVGTLPRVEAASDLVERTLNRTHRVTTAPDRIPATGLPWVPVTAVAALVLVTLALVTQWIGLGPDSQMPRQQWSAGVEPSRSNTATPVSGVDSPSREESLDPLVAVADSVFDHNEDIEFVLDPVTLRRGRATVTRLPSGVQTEHAVITF